MLKHPLAGSAIIYLRQNRFNRFIRYLMDKQPSSVPIPQLNASKKRPYNENKGRIARGKKKRLFNKSNDTGGQDDVLLHDIRSLLRNRAGEAPGPGQSEEQGFNGAADLPELFSEVELEVFEISSTGDGLALRTGSNQVYVVPFTAPGDKVVAKVYRHVKEKSYSLTDFVRVIKPSSIRNESLVNCKYFASCSGCQFQMLPYNYQLDHKKKIIEKAYKNFSNLPSEAIPQVEETIESPLQYGYRTKLTPHYDRPPGKRSDRRNGLQRGFDELPPFGFNQKGGRKILDIEDCPIGTDAVRLGMKRERHRLATEYKSCKNGATVLLRENTERLQDDKDKYGLEDIGKDRVVEKTDSHVFVKTCETNSNSITTEYVGDFIFKNKAGSFFQNNNSILPVFTQYIRDHILPPNSTLPASRVTNLIDAYSGSGLFTISLYSLFKCSLGIDISQASIVDAKENATLNNLHPEHASFIAADAAELFKDVKFPANETAIVIDPPRKGCDRTFLRQLLEYSPARIVYVSCNVHTQARDVGILVTGMDEVDGEFGSGKGVYEIESLRGFDFFPQTGHVEGVAVLRKKITGEEEDNGSEE